MCYDLTTYEIGTQKHRGVLGSYQIITIKIRNDHKTVKVVGRVKINPSSQNAN
jgi:hypothetical protein